MTASMMPEAELDDSDYTDDCDDSTSATSEEPICLSESETDYSGKLIICLYIFWYSCIHRQLNSCIWEPIQHACDT